MIEENQGQSPDMLGLASEIVAAYVSNNRVSAAELPGLIGSVHAALHGIAGGMAAGGASAPDEEVEKPTPAQIKKSIRPDGLVSFIDGKAYKTLKRHLTKHGLDPHSYREKFGLPADYPTTSAAYSEPARRWPRALASAGPAAWLPDRQHQPTSEVRCDPLAGFGVSARAVAATLGLAGTVSGGRPP